MSKRKRKTASEVSEITFKGGSYNKKKLLFAYPTPKYLLMGFGTELYVRNAGGNDIDCEYIFTDDWTEYDKYWDFRKDRPLIND